MTDKEVIESQAQQIKMLEAKVMDLLKIIQEMSVKKSSHNSSLAPSTDFFKKNKSLRTKSNLKSGGQPGHKGSTLEMKAVPDKVIELKSDFCSICGTSTIDSLQILKSKRQVIEIPPIVPIYEEYQQFSCECKHCGHLQIATFPEEVKAPIQYGSSVDTIISYLSIYQSVPFNRLKKMFSQVYSLPISEGTINNVLTRVAMNCAVIYEQIKANIVDSKIVGSDETGVKVNGGKWWIWVWQNIQNTFIAASPNRGFQTINSIFADGFSKATLISDRWAAQLKTYTKNHQLCLAHLLRELNFLEELEQNEFSTKFKTLIDAVFELKRNQKTLNTPTKIDSEEAKKLENKLNESLSMIIDKKKYPKTSIFQLSMIKNRNYILPCIYDLEIPADNNASERAIRNIKVKQKVSGQFKSGQHSYCVIRSVIDTLIKRNLEVIHHLNLIIKAKIQFVENT
jgi:transposase